MSHYQEADEIKARYSAPEHWPAWAKLIWTYKWSLGLLAASIVVAGESNLVGREMLPLYIVGASIYIVGRVVDKASTLRTLAIMSTADNLGIPHDLYETHPELPAKPSRQDMLGPRRITSEIISEIGGIVFPPFGTMLGFLSLGGALHNFQAGNDLAKQIKAAQS